MSVGKKMETCACTVDRNNGHKTPSPSVTILDRNYQQITLMSNSRQDTLF